ncbi:MAG TPA: GGDEF domain-containing protein [Candidatus Angelobacter sp.]|nr:GGDEF domain-containing protein [Candidatus Angelobacter sp.]
MTITEYLDGKSQGVLLALGTLLLVLVASGDYLTHTNYALEFSPVYLVPVSFFSWFIGKRAGIALAVISVVFGFLIRLNTLPRVIASWDALVWLVLYTSFSMVVSQLKLLYAHERHASRIDPLTGVENRRALFESAAKAMNFSDRHGVPLSIAYLDLDGFKGFNDRLGHEAGDKLLVVVATKIRGAIRPTDAIGRMGGDEFVLILPESDTETAARILDRVRLDLDRAMREWRWPITFSIGLVSFSPPLRPVAEMFRAADDAMYAAKSAGKDRVEQRDLAS